MKINGYEFDIYNKGSLEHISRHLEKSEVIGSKFYRNIFANEKEIVDYAINFILDYNGKKIEREIDYGKIVGTSSLINLKNLPKEAKITKGKRGINEKYIVNIVEGIPIKETSQIAIIAGPTESNLHIFYTIFPGIVTPPFPLTEEKIKEEIKKGRKLEEIIKLNEISLKFWNNHGFIK